MRRSGRAERAAGRRRDEPARLRVRAGFTLLEAIVAMTVIGLAAVSSLAAFGAELRTADRVQRALPAAALAEQRTQTLALLDPRALDVLPDSVRNGRFLPPFGDYTWESELRQVPDESDLYDAVTVVRWDAGGSYTLRTRFLRPQPSLTVRAEGR